MNYDLKISGFRAAFPGYKDMPSEQILKGLQQKYYADMSMDQIADSVYKKYGYAEEKTSIGDAWKAGGKAALTGLGNAVDFMGHILGQVSTYDVDWYPQVRKEFAIVSEPIREKAEKIDVAMPTGKLSRPPEGGYLNEITADPVTAAQRAYMTMAQNAPLMGVMVASSIANPVFGTVVIGSIEGGETLAEMEKWERQNNQKIDPLMKATFPVMVGAANAALERIGIEKILGVGKVPGIRGKIVQLALATGTETSTETVQEINQLLAEYGYKGKLEANAVQRVKDSAYGGFILGFAGSMVSGGSGEAKQRMDRSDVTRALVEHGATAEQAENIVNEAMKVKPNERAELIGKLMRTIQEVERKKVKSENTRIDLDAAGDVIKGTKQYEIQPDDIDLMIDQLENARFERGKDWAMSTAPQWFQAMNRKYDLAGKVNRNDALAVLRKVRDGKELTDRQQSIWDEMKSEYEYEVGEAVQEEPTAGPVEEKTGEPWESWTVDEEPQPETAPAVQEDLFIENADGSRQVVDRQTVDRAKGKATEQTQGDQYQQGVNFAPPMPTQAQPDVEQVGRDEIRAYIDKEFDVPIRKGARGGGHRKSVLGLYLGHEEAILEKVWGDIWTEAHEVAHHVDKKLGITAKLHMYSDTLKKELKALDYDPKKRRVNEGFAEFIRHDLTIGDARKLAPNFYQHWENILSKDPELKQKYETLKDMYRRYHQQGAESRIDAQVDTENKGAKLPLGLKIKRASQRLYSLFVDSLKPLDTIVTEARKEKARKDNTLYTPLEIDQDPYELATFLKGTSRSKAEAWVMDRTFDYVGRTTGKSLLETLNPVIKAGKIKEFVRYLIARRALVLADRGIDVGVELADAKYVFDKYESPEWHRISDEFHDWADRALDYLEEAGGLSKEAHQAIRDLNPFYVALKRHFADEQGGIAGSAGRGIANVSSPIKRIHGGGEMIVNPIEGMIAEVHKIILAADRIRVARAIAELNDIEGMGRLIQKMDPPMEGKEFNLGAIAADLERMGIDLAGADLDALLTVFTQSNNFKGKNDTVQFWRDGKRVYYKIDPQLHEALMSLETKRLPKVLDMIFSPFTKMKRLFTTGINFGFGLVRNPMRDIMTATMYTKGRGNVLESGARSIKGVIKDVTGDPIARRFKELGGEMATMMGQDRSSTMRVVDKMVMQNKSFAGKVMYAVSHPGQVIDILRNIAQITEMGPRVGEFEMLLRMGEAKYGKDDPRAVIEAFNSARDLTVNFSRNGTYGQILNQIIPFWNATMQGADKAVRFARQHPVKFAVRGIGNIMIPSLVLWAINRDKEWYKDLPLSYKYLNWFIQVDDKTVIRIPKPFELGVLFGGFVEAVLDQTTDVDDDAISEWGGLMVGSLFPGVIPATFEPATEVGLNRDWLLRPIESAEMQRMMKTERYRENTSELAKAMSRGMEKLFPEGWILGPAQIDHLLNGYTGGMWRGMRWAGKERKTKSDIPVAGTLFMRLGTTPRRYVDNAYGISTRVEEVYNTWRMYEKRGDTATANGIRARHPEIEHIREVQRLRKRITELCKLRRANEGDEQTIKQIDAEIRERSEAMRKLVNESGSK